MSGRDGDHDVLRMNVRLSRAEHPDLYDELIQVDKGLRRIQRLKNLASERLLLARCATVPLPRAAGPLPAAPLAPAEDVAAAHELFLPPAK